MIFARSFLAFDAITSIPLDFTQDEVTIEAVP